jgi:hypothetical protein
MVMFRNLVIGLAIALVAACATTNPTPYNPEHLNTNQATEIGQICQDVMGFKPTAPAVDNAWPGDPDPGAETNGYRGCIASLSRSLLTSGAARATSAADRACRGEGLTDGSPALAECVLKRAQAVRPAAAAQSVSLVVTPFEDGQGPNSWSHQTERREQQACAQIGLEPAGSQYASCLNGLSDVITAMRLGRDYRD